MNFIKRWFSDPSIEELREGLRGRMWGQFEKNRLRSSTGEKYRLACGLFLNAPHLAIVARGKFVWMKTAPSLTTITMDFKVKRDHRLVQVRVPALEYFGTLQSDWKYMERFDRIDFKSILVTEGIYHSLIIKD